MLIMSTADLPPQKDLEVAAAHVLREVPGRVAGCKEPQLAAVMLPAITSLVYRVAKFQCNRFQALLLVHPATS